MKVFLLPGDTSRLGKDSIVKFMGRGNDDSKVSHAHGIVYKTHDKGGNGEEVRVVGHCP